MTQTIDIGDGWTVCLGCFMSFRSNELNEHGQRCNEYRDMCLFSKWGCTFEGTRSELRAHERMCPHSRKMSELKTLLDEYPHSYTTLPELSTQFSPTSHFLPSSSSLSSISSRLSVSSTSTASSSSSNSATDSPLGCLSPVGSDTLSPSSFAQAASAPASLDMQAGLMSLGLSAAAAASLVNAAVQANAVTNTGASTAPSAAVPGAAAAGTAASAGTANNARLNKNPLFSRFIRKHKEMEGDQVVIIGDRDQTFALTLVDVSPGIIRLRKEADRGIHPKDIKFYVQDVFDPHVSEYQREGIMPPMRVTDSSVAGGSIQPTFHATPGQELTLIDLMRVLGRCLYKKTQLLRVNEDIIRRAETILREKRNSMVSDLRHHAMLQQHQQQGASQQTPSTVQQQQTQSQQHHAAAPSSSVPAQQQHMSVMGLSQQFAAEQQQHHHASAVASTFFSSLAKHALAFPLTSVH